MDESKIVEDFLSYYRTQDEAYEWAHQALEKKIMVAAQLDLILDLLHACENDEEIAYVASGPLEDAIERHYGVIHKDLESLVRQDLLMRKAITGVWLSEGSAPRKMLDEILSKFGLIYSSL